MNDEKTSPKTRFFHVTENIVRQKKLEEEIRFVSLFLSIVEFSFYFFWQTYVGRADEGRYQKDRPPHCLHVTFVFIIQLCIYSLLCLQRQRRRRQEGRKSARFAGVGRRHSGAGRRRQEARQDRQVGREVKRRCRQQGRKDSPLTLVLLRNAVIHIFSSQQDQAKIQELKKKLRLVGNMVETALSKLGKATGEFEKFLNQPMLDKLNAVAEVLIGVHEQID